MATSEGGCYNDCFRGCCKNGRCVRPFKSLLRHSVKISLRHPIEPIETHFKVLSETFYQEFYWDILSRIVLRLSIKTLLRHSIISLMGCSRTFKPPKFVMILLSIAWWDTLPRACCETLSRACCDTLSKVCWQILSRACCDTPSKVSWQILSRACCDTLSKVCWGT